ALALRTRVLTSIAKLHPNEAIPHARETLRQAEALALDLFIAVSHMLIGTVHVLQDRLAESEPEFADAIAVAGDALPQVAIAAKAAAASGYRGVDVARSIALAREAIVIEERADIMPVFRAIAADLIAWHRARTGALEDSVTALAAIDALRARLGFAGIW